MKNELVMHVIILNQMKIPMLRGIFNAKSYLRTALGLYLSHLHMGADTACPLLCPYAML